MQKQDRLIVALDVPDIDSAKKLVEETSDFVSFYKVGLELMMSGEYFNLIKWLKSKNKKVFADLKLYDISKTVERSIQNLTKFEIDLLTIHTASRDIMQCAADVKGETKVVGVTVLTNLNQSDLNEMGFDPEISLDELVDKKTNLALESGLDGVVSSALEAKKLRNNFGNDFIIVSPGIRLEKVENDDQKRTCDVKEALSNGSSYLVVGRPITRADNPKEAAQKFSKLILE